MALTPLVTALLAEQIKLGARIASMGYPDLIAPPEMIAGILGDRLPELKYREDSVQIAKWHGLPSGSQVPDAASFFALQGATLDVFDVAEIRGGEIIGDLNQTHWLWRERAGQYDFVLDVGTLEHCFNIGQAALNVAGLLKEGGIIYHTNPHSGWGNHGFYSIHPTFYYDFYESNGFKVLGCLLFDRKNNLYQAPPHRRFTPNGDMNIYCSAQREKVKMLTYPTQRKYRPEA